MPRQYTHLKEVEAEVFKLKEEGKTNREIAAYFGVTKAQIKSLINRHNRNESELEQGIIVKTKGRPRKRPLTPEEEKDREIARLKMENELLRDFLHLAGRK